MESTTTEGPRSTTSGASLSPTSGPATNGLSEAVSEEPASKRGSRTKLYAIVAGIALVVLFTLLTIGLYALGDSSQSSLERLRDIAVVYIVLISLILVIIMAAATAALVYLILQIKNQVIPMLDELTGTINRVRGTTEFMTDEAVKPVINAAGKVAQWKAMIRVATGREPK